MNFPTTLRWVPIEAGGRTFLTMWRTLRAHWPEYGMEAAGLGLFMISACGFGVLLEHPASPVRQGIADPFWRRAIMGFAMGLTAVGIIYSPWGKQSGAHINPAVTLTFYRLGKVSGWDAVFYILAQFLGGISGVALPAVVAGTWLRDPAIHYVVTVPGPAGAGAAFVAEALISFLLMTCVLVATNIPKLARWTGWLAGGCVAVFILWEAPFSGMSMNPARSVGSSALPGTWTDWWIYFVAPVLGMLVAAQGYLLFRRRPACAKLHHQNSKRCIFCEHQNQPQRNRQSVRSVPLVPC